MNNKNYITQQNIWSDGGKKVPSRNMSVTIPKKTETRILMGSYLSKHEYIVFSDALKYAEWNRGSMYIQGICLGALTSLFFLALFSAYSMTSLSLEIPFICSGESNTKPFRDRSRESAT